MAKKATGGYELGPKAIGQIQELWRDYQARARAGGGSNAAEPFTKFGPRVFRWAKCKANSLCQAYPTKPANNFPVVFGEMDVDTDSCGYVSRSFTEYDPPEERIAHDPQDVWHDEGDIVPVYLAHGKWYILSTANEQFAEAVLDDDMCPQDTGDDFPVVVDAKFIGTCKEFTPDLVVNPYRHRGKIGRKVLLLRRNCKQDEQDAEPTEEWWVIDVEKHKLCTVNGIKRRFNSGTTDRGAIVFGPVIVGSEWCAADEPDEACELITFGPCASTVTADDLSWTVLIGDCCTIT